MKTTSRITSIQNAPMLDASITGVPSFDISQLNIVNNLAIELPTNVRLGHLAEYVVSRLIKASTNYKLLYENVQIIENKKTIGELDFIIEDITKKEFIHLELAYKFYLFDPTISDDPIHNWIGPNRNDSLVAKLEKLTTKQFPLLHHRCTEATLSNLDCSTISQALCLLVSLFIPYGTKTTLDPVYEKAIKGYYLNFKQFRSLDHSEKLYYLPSKKEWGMDPEENETWTDFQGIEQLLTTSLQEKQAPLCWQKYKDSYEIFFIVWW